MSSIITITVYTLDELSCPARGKARDWYRQHHADSNWYENVYEDFREVCGIFGIDLRQRVFRLSNGRFMEEPCIWFSGFCSQGDGACFEGRWHWQPATPRKIREYAPQDRELHRIADTLQAVQKRNFWQLQAEISHRGRYCHPYSSLNYHSPIFCEDFIMSDTLPGTTLPDDNKDLPWWGLPCTVTPCFGACLVQEGNRLHYLADRAGIRGRFSDADAYHPDQAFPLLMKQPELMLTSGELNPRHQHTVTLYAKGLTCEADTLGSCDYVYLAVYPTPEMKN